MRKNYYRQNLKIIYSFSLRALNSKPKHVSKLSQRKTQSHVPPNLVRKKKT